MTDLTQIIDFLSLAMKLKQTYRFTPKENGLFENDAEHSWAVALVCMLLATRLEEEHSVKIDTERMLKMALVHDLAEVLTGDTKTWDKAARVGKDERERLAITEILSKLPQDLNEEMMSLWEESEAKETLEAKIVKSVDRLEPVLHRTLLQFGWENVKEDGEHGSVSALDSRQLPRHQFSKLITEIYNEVKNMAIEEDMFT